MTQEFDRLIRDAAAEVPDPGEFRRLNRALLKGRLSDSASRSRRAARRNRALAAMFCGLVIIAFVPRLGSDSFDLEQETVTIDNVGEVVFHASPFRGTSFNVAEDYTEQDIDELNRQIAAGEGRTVRVTGLSWGGKTHWIKHVEHDINGRIRQMGGAPEDPPSQQLDRLPEYLHAYGSEFKEIKNTQPHDREEVLTVDGIPVRFRIWVADFPEVGEVTLYEGVPEAGAD